MVYGHVSADRAVAFLPRTCWLKCINTFALPHADVTSLRGFTRSNLIHSIIYNLVVPFFVSHTDTSSITFCSTSAKLSNHQKVNKKLFPDSYRDCDRQFSHEKCETAAKNNRLRMPTLLYFYCYCCTKS